jgi:cold shock protein
MQDQDGALVETELPEAAFDEIAIREPAGHVAAGGGFDRGQLDLDRPSPAPAGVVEAGVDGQSVEPGIEPIRVAQAREVMPGSEVGLLNRVPRELLVPEDEAGDSLQPRDGRAGQHGEGVMIAPPCPLDEFPLVHGHPRDAPHSVAFKGNGVADNRTIPCDRRPFRRRSMTAAFFRDRPAIEHLCYALASPRCATMLRVVDPFSNGPCDLRSLVREVLEVIMTTGTIKKVVADRGFGFITAEDEKEYFFHRGGLDSSLDFDRLIGGEKVEFEIEASPKGPRAAKVHSA